MTASPIGSSSARTSGEPLIPAKGGFGPCFKPVKYQQRQYLPGCDKASLDKDASSCPRGAPTIAYKWERVAGIADTECKL